MLIPVKRDCLEMDLFKLKETIWNCLDLQKRIKEQALSLDQFPNFLVRLREHKKEKAYGESNSFVRLYFQNLDSNQDLQLSPSLFKLSSSDLDWEEQSSLADIELSLVLSSFPKGLVFLRYCEEQGLQTLIQLIDLDFSNLKIKGIVRDKLLAIRMHVWEHIIHQLLSPCLQEATKVDAITLASENFEDALEGLRDKQRNVLLMRAKGYSLQAIGEQFSFSRERARQLVLKASLKLQDRAKALFLSILREKKSLSAYQLNDVVKSHDYRLVLTYLWQQMRDIIYFKFADKYVLQENLPNDWVEKLKKIQELVVDDYVDYYEQMEFVEELLEREQLSFFDAIDYMGYLLDQGYQNYGNCLVKTHQSYRYLCLEIIRKYFYEGIKLDSDEQNPDIKRLRELVQREYGNVTLSDNNRALTARLTENLVLSGRGRYRLLESIEISSVLLQEIVNYLHRQESSTVYYGELYALFKDRLNGLSNLDNHHALHGVLKAFYPDEFTYKRDYLIKKGELKSTFEERFEAFVLEKGRAVTKKEILEKFVGLTDIRIFNALIRSKNLIQWDYHQFNHRKLVQFSSEELAQFELGLEELLLVGDGYVSERKLYRTLNYILSDAFERLDIVNSHNLFYVTEMIFEGKYRFSRPHIAKLDYPVSQLTFHDLFIAFLSGKERIDYQSIKEVIDRYEWSEVSASASLAEFLNTSYCAVEREQYVLQTLLMASESELGAISAWLSEQVEEKGYLPLFDLPSMEKLPNLSFEWNGFLLQSIIEHYGLPFRVLEPAQPDRRYRKGVIVSYTGGYESYEDLVISEWKKDMVSAMSEEDFLDYLKRKKLVSFNQIPKKLQDTKKFSFKNGFYYLATNAC